MPLTRLFIRGDVRAGQTVQLDADQARYIGRVLRLRPGDALSVFNGDSGEFHASVISIDKATAALAVGEAIATRSESPLRLHLVQGISRGERMDLVVQKATELGVKRITPVFTEYGVVRLDADRAGKRREHWQKIAASATEQSGRIRPPLLDSPLALCDWLASKPSATDVDLVLAPGAPLAMASIAAPATKVCLLIGPEGGFSEAEYAAADAAGFRAVSLGPRVLRTETAAIAAVTAAALLWGDLGLD